MSGRPLRGAVLVGAAFAGGLFAGATVVQQAHGGARDAYAGLDTLARAINTIEARYVEAVDTEELLYGAVRGMVQHLDPWSSFLSPAEWRSLQDHADGAAEGVGVRLARTESGAVRLVEVIRGGPADRAGARTGALLLGIDGQPVDDAPLDDVMARLEGDRGTAVTLTVDQGAGPQDLPTLRERYEEQVVLASVDDRDALVLRVTHFSRATRAQLDAAWRAHVEAHGLPPALFLDLRDNPGGLMDQAAAVVDRFVGAGLAVESRGRDGAPLDRFDTHDDDDDITVPMVVLVDEGSASAAEVVAGALRDRGRAPLVGRRTYGKGTVQHVFEMEDGSALKLTLGRYHLPSGATLPDRAGLEPDHPVPATPADAAAALRAGIRTARLPPRTERDLLAQVDAALPDPPPPSDTDPFLEAAWVALGGR